MAEDMVTLLQQALAKLDDPEARALHHKEQEELLERADEDED
jgi:hypothetical protein